MDIVTTDGNRTETGGTISKSYSRQAVNSLCETMIPLKSESQTTSLSDSARSEPRSDPGKGVLVGFVRLSICPFVRLSICPALFKKCTRPILLKFLMLCTIRV